MINIINTIDFLSPSITLFHLEKRTHTSILGGVFVLIMLLIISTYICVLLYNLSTHRRITSLFHKRFEYEAGYYPFNSSSIFHFLQIFSQENGGYYNDFDSKYIRAYTTYVSSNSSYENLDLYDHWVFNTCRESVDNKNIDRYIFDNVENFTKGVCIRHFFNSTERKYYSLEEDGFEWPHLEHGTAHRNNIFLTTIVQKCSNDSILSELFGPCADTIDIDEYIKKFLSIHLYFTDTQVDPTNYANPVQKYLQVMNAGISLSDTFIENYIYFSPLKIMTNIGTIFPKHYEYNSFCFDYYTKGAVHHDDDEYSIITKFYHLMQNNIQIYERKYNNIFDIFSEIGGVIQFIFYLFYWVNFIYNKYIIAYDTNSLFFSIRDNNNQSAREFLNQKNNLNKNDIKLLNLKSNIDRNMKKSKCFINKKYINYDSNKEKNINKDKKLMVFGSEIINRKNEPKQNEIIIINNKNKKLSLNLPKKQTPPKSQTKLYINQNSSNILLKESVNNIKNNSFGEIYKKLEINLGKDIKDKYNQSNLNIISLSRESLGKIDHRHKDNSSELSDEKLKSIKVFSFKDFLKSIIFKGNKGNHYFIDIFRKHLLSEEHFLKNHIKMVFLEKQHNLGEDENTNVLECFNEL